ncbi:hypothetical protein QTP88_000277 [Uroleucon formosanum]
MASRTMSSIKIVNNQIIRKNNEDKNKNKNKRNLSTSSTPPQSPFYTACIKKAKSFVTPNRYTSILSVDEPTIENLNVISDNQNEEQLNTSNNTPKTILPPPIFIKRVLNYMGLLNQFKQIIGPNTLSCKSTSTHLKVQTDAPDNYRKTIHLLKEINVQYHTYQLQSDKPLRVVIRNLHSYTPESDITTALEEIGYTVRNVTNVKHRQTKTSLPVLFIDIDPNEESVTDIFSITSILHTKVKIEELYKKRQIPQYQNCQSYGHTRSYCAYPPICVKCGQNHLSSSCTKSPDLPAKCGLCQGAHPANYKGCTIYQTISRKHNNTSSKKAQQSPPPNLNINTNPEYQQQQPGSENTPKLRTPQANLGNSHPQQKTCLKQSLSPITLSPHITTHQLKKKYYYTNFYSNLSGHTVSNSGVQPKSPT